MLLLIVTAITVFMNVVLGLFVLFKNTKSVTNRMFFGLTLIFTAWTITTFISTNPILLPQIIWVRLVLFTAALLNLFVYLTFDVFPSAHFSSRKRVRWFVIAVTPPVMLLTLTPYVFQGINVSADGSVTPLPAAGIVVFMSQTVGLLGGGAFLLVRRLQNNRGIERQQLKYVLAGLVTSFGLIVITNLFAVAIFGSVLLVQFGPAFTIFFSGFVGYAIIKHRLFDIRAIVARSVAYVLLLFTLAGLYGLAVFSLSILFFGRQEIPYYQTFLYIILAIILTFTFQPLRRFFEKLTDNIFYRDRYDTQEVIDHLSKILVAQIDMKTIIANSLEAICDHMKLSHGRLMVIDDGKIYKMAEHAHPPLKFDAADLNFLNQNIFITDELIDSSPKHILQKYDAAACLRLKTQEGIVGYLLLGPKQNGSTYNQQDVKLLEIISNELGVAIQNARSFEKIANFNINLQEQIKKATSDLRSSNRKLKQLDKAKDEFISMASHQLRTPLTTIRGYLSMLLEGDVGSVKKSQREFVERAYSGSQQMVYLIADMLNVSRISTGKLVFDRQLVDLDEVIKNEIKQLKHRAEGKNVELDYKTSKIKPPLLNLDESKTRQVLANFIDNSIDYAPDTVVKIKLEQIDNKVRFSVKDQGIGVPAEQQKNLFHKFFRAGNAQRLRPDGTGLGLYMAKMVIEKQGGRIIFESREGKGSTFGFEFEIDNSSLQTDDLI